MERQTNKILLHATPRINVFLGFNMQRAMMLSVLHRLALAVV